MIKQEYEYDDIIYNIKIGENAQDNWDIIDDSKQNDIWFHVESHPSAHVVLEACNHKKIPKVLINHCAVLCKQHSKLKYNRKLKIIYTEIKNVRKADKPGSVTTRKTQILVI